MPYSRAAGNGSFVPMHDDRKCAEAGGEMSAFGIVAMRALGPSVGRLLTGRSATAGCRSSPSTAPGSTPPTSTAR